MLSKFGEWKSLNVGDMAAKRGDDGCHHGAIVFSRLAGTSNVPSRAKIEKIGRCRGIF